MGVVVNLNGVLCAPEDARISVFDRQFLYGDGIYETLKTVGGRLFMVAPHLDRLMGSALALGIPCPLSEEGWREELERTVAAAANEETVVRVIVTRGEGEPGLAFSGDERPNWLLIARPKSPLNPDIYRDGCDVSIPHVRRTSPEAISSAVKSGNYLNQVMALAEGRQRGAYEVVMLSGAGHVTEGSTSNVFFVRDGVLHTPTVSAGVLPGVTRALTLGLAGKLGIPVARGLFEADALRGADEAFLTATLKEIVPIHRIDGVPVGRTCPGPMTRALREAYDALVSRCRQTGLSAEEERALVAAGKDNAV